MRRAGYTGFKCNAAVAMVNRLARLDEPPVAAVTALRDALEEDEPLAREHVAWALGKLGSTQAREALSLALRNERDRSVCV